MDEADAGTDDPVDSAASADVPNPADADRVRAVLADILSGQREINPLGAVTLLLRDQSSWRIRQSRIETTAQLARDLQS